jgi:hypothetical protein
MSEKLKDALVLLAEVAGLLVVFMALLLTLNFFNILSLSTIYPNQLGFLPHLNQPSNSSATQNKAVTPSPSSPSVDTSIITTKDFVSNISKYKTYALPAPIFSTENKNWQADGVLAGYGKNSIMLISSNSTLVFNVNTQTIFEEVAISNLPGSSGGATLGFKPYADFNSFIKNVSLGKYVQVYYTQDKLASGKTAIKVDYVPSYQLK